MYHAAHPVAGTQIPCYVFEANTDVARHVAQMMRIKGYV